MKSKEHKFLLIAPLLLCTTLSLVGQQGRPPYQTPPTFPSQQLPPDSQAPPSQRTSSAKIEQQIQDSLQSDTSLAGTSVKATVDDTSVVLTGTVNSDKQHATALFIARSFAGARTITDGIKVTGQSPRTF